MILYFIKLIFGSLRLFFTILMVGFGMAIVYADVFREIEVNNNCYAFLTGIIAQVIAYQIIETKKSSNNTAYFSFIKRMLCKALRL